MRRTISILIARTVAGTIRLFKVGAGSTLPGYLALLLYPRLLQKLNTRNLTIIVISGTNGKTTTTNMISSIMETEHPGRVISNITGANLLRGIATTLLLHTKYDGTVNADVAVLEVDENVVPQLLAEMPVSAIVLLNLFRDQLDRYGEIHNIAELWKNALAKQNALLVANADDPLIAMIGHTYSGRTVYFGVAKKDDTQGADTAEVADSLYCPICTTKLNYHSVMYSHFGDYECPKCGFARPSVDERGTSINSPLPGTYNKYNTAAAVVLAYALKIPEENIRTGIAASSSVFGRQEVITYKNKRVQLFLVKNPTSFNQSLQTALDLNATIALFVLNDRIPDGRDVSWVWDINLEKYIDRFSHVIVSGDRSYDMALRVQYALSDSTNKLNAVAIEDALDRVAAVAGEEDTIAIFPTYSAMLDVRERLVGRKIL